MDHIITSRCTKIRNIDETLFTVLSPVKPTSSGSSHYFLLCQNCNRASLHPSTDIIIGTIHHYCTDDESLHPNLKDIISPEMTETEDWVLSDEFEGYEISSCGRIRNSKGKILAPTSATEEGRVYYVIREESVCHLRFIEEWINKRK